MDVAWETGEIRIKKPYTSSLEYFGQQWDLLQLGNKIQGSSVPPMYRSYIYHKYNKKGKKIDNTPFSFITVAYFYIHFKIFSLCRVVLLLWFRLLFNLSLGARFTLLSFQLQQDNWSKYIVLLSHSCTIYHYPDKWNHTSQHCDLFLWHA